MTVLLRERVLAARPPGHGKWGGLYDEYKLLRQNGFMGPAALTWLENDAEGSQLCPWLKLKTAAAQAAMRDQADKACRQKWMRDKRRNIPN